MSAKKIIKNLDEAVYLRTNQPIKVDTDNLFAKIGVDIDDQKSKSKTSFYITRLTQAFLRATSDTYGVPQGDIINYATPMFAKIAQLSLNRREKSLASLRALNQQIQDIIKEMGSISPHLNNLFSIPAEMITQIIDLEDEAVKAKVIEGLGIRKDNISNEVPYPLWPIFPDEPESEPAYAKELREFFEGNAFDILIQVARDKGMKEKEVEDETDETRTN